MSSRKLIAVLIGAFLFFGPLVLSPAARSSEDGNSNAHKKAVKDADKKSSSKLSRKATTRKTTKELTEDQAIDVVAKLPEVKKWSKLLSSTKGAGNPGYMADRDGAKWVVQVFESKPEQNVTFGYYDVDAGTGAVKKEEP